MVNNLYETLNELNIITKKKNQHKYSKINRKQEWDHKGNPNTSKESNEEVNICLIIKCEYDDEVTSISYKQMYDLSLKVSKENDEIEKIMTYKKIC